jgi:hypothetical protein
MTTTREQAAQALFNLLASSYAYPVASRRFMSWDGVASSQKPALFLLEYSETHTRTHQPTPARRVLMTQALIFIANGLDPEAVPITNLNNLIDLIDPVSGGVLKPDDIWQNRQTLGGIVYDCYIEGTITKVPGDIDGQGMATIPIKIIFN